MLIPEIGEILRSKLTGKDYELRKITDHMAILHSLDGLSQVLTWRENLKLFYNKVSIGEVTKKSNSCETHFSALRRGALVGGGVDLSKLRKVMETY